MNVTGLLVVVVVACTFGLARGFCQGFPFPFIHAVRGDFLPVSHVLKKEALGWRPLLVGWRPYV